MKKAKEKVRFKVSIRGEPWIIKVYTHGQFTKMYPYDVACTTYDHKSNFRVIEFSYPHASKNTIAHELWHAYMSYYYCRKRKFDAIEEDLAEIIGRIQPRLNELVQYIYKKAHKRKK